MRLDFKRFLSGVLALVMMTSALTMVNVSSVMAEDSPIWNSSDSSTPGWLTLSSTSTAGVKADYQDVSFTADIFDGDTTRKLGTHKGVSLGSGADSKPSFTVETSGNAEINIYVARDNKGNSSLKVIRSTTGLIKTGDSATAAESSAETISLRDTTEAIPAIHFSLVGADTYKFIFNGSSHLLFRIELTDASSGTENTWVLDNKNVSSLNGDLHLVSTTTKGTTNTLVYTGTDYKLNPLYATITPSLKVNGQPIVTQQGNKYTVTPTMDMFMKNVKLEHNDISITDGDGRVLHLTCKEHGTTYSILLGQSLEGEPAHAEAMLVSADNEYGSYTKSDEIDLPIHNGKYRVTMGGGTVEIDGADKDTDGTPLVDIQEHGTDVTGTFKPTERINISKAVNGIKFTNLLTTADARAERLMGGTVVGDTDTEKGFLRVVGEGYLNVYALSGTASEHGTNAKAIVIRAAAEGEEGATGAIKGGGLGFTIANKDTVGSKTFNVIVHAEAVKDKNTAGTESDLGLAKIKNDGIGAEAVGDEITSMKVTKVGDTDNIDESNAEAITFTTALEAGESYVLYNKGAAESQGNIRIYSIDFTEASGEAPGKVVFKDKLNPADYTADSKKQFADEYIDAENKFHVGASSTKVCIDSISFSGNVELDDETVLNSQSNKINALKLSGGGSKTKDHVSFTTTEANGKIYVYGKSSNTNRKIKFDSDSGVSDEKSFTQTAKAEKFVFDAKNADTYYIYSSSSNNFDILFIGSTVPLKGAEIPKHNITIKATNNTSKEVTVTLKDGLTFVVPANATADSPITVNDVPEGSYTLSAPGCTITGADITVSDTSKAFDITIDESKNVTVKFEMSDATKPDDNITITPASGKAQTISKNNGTPVTFDDVAPGTVFTIESTAKNVWKWVAKTDKAVETNTYKWDTYADSRKYIKYDTDHLTYTLPDAESIDTSAEYGITFTASSDMATAAKETDSLYVKTEASPLSFGQYAFGDSKALDACGRSWARNYVKYKLTPLSLSDFNSKRTARYYNSLPDDPEGRTNNNRTKEIDNAYAALSQNTVPGGNAANATNYIEFTIDSNAKNNAEPEGELTIQIDRDNGIDLYDMTSGNGTKVNASAYIANTEGTKVSKQEFPVKAGKTYRIVASGYTYTKSGDAKWGENEVLTEEPSGADKATTSATVYVKSIRMFNPNNIFDGVQDEETLVAPTNVGKWSEINGEESALKKALTDATTDIAGVDANATVFRIIGMLDLAGINGLDASSDITRDDLENAVANITSVGYDVYEKTDYEQADTQGIYYHEGVHTSTHQPKIKGSIEITDVVNTGYDLDGTEEDPHVTGTIDPEKLSAKVFTQTFYATTESLTLVPWVKYAGDDTKVYSLVQKTDDSTSNNKELIVTE